MAAADLKQVVRVVADAHNFPATEEARARQMVADGLAFALPEPGKPSHQYQEQIVDAAERILQDALQHSTGAIDTSNASIIEAEQRSESTKTVAAAAKSAAEDANADLKEKSSAVQSKRKEISGLDVEHKEVAKSEQAYQEIFDAKRQRKELADEGNKVLREVEAAELSMSMEGAIGAVEAFLTGSGAEKALLAAVPGALRCDPKARKGFDVVAWETIAALATKEAAAIEEQLAQVTRDRDYAEAETLGAWAIADVQRDRLQELVTLQDEAKSCLQEKQQAEEAATHVAAEELLKVRKAKGIYNLAIQSKAELESTLSTLAALRTPEPLRQPQEAASPAAARSEPQSATKHSDCERVPEGVVQALGA